MITLGITSSIASYKVLYLIKKLKPEFELNVIATKNTLNLIPLSEFEKEIKIYTELFHHEKIYKDYFNDIDHLSLAKADLLVIVPATANVIGKIAQGIADDLLTTTVMAATCQKIIVPAMHTEMYNNPIVQENIAKLKQHSYMFVGPEIGHLACGDNGIGRLVDMEMLYNEIKLFFAQQFLTGKKVLITAGPTVERIDPMRYISNFSSGKMGCELTRVAQRLGADVTLITGPICIEVSGITAIHVESAEEMHHEVMKQAPTMDIVIMAAAVADFKPKYSAEKIKKKRKLVLELEANPDILAELGRKKKKNQVMVGFALETNNILENARKKFKEKKVDMLVVNTDKSIGSEKSEVVLLTKKGEKKLPLLSKKEVAQNIFEEIKKIVP